MICRGFHIDLYTQSAEVFGLHIRNGTNVISITMKFLIAKIQIKLFDLMALITRAIIYENVVGASIRIGCSMETNRLVHKNKTTNKTSRARRVSIACFSTFRNQLFNHDLFMRRIFYDLRCNMFCKILSFVFFNYFYFF